VVIEELEEAQLQIQTLLSIRHVAPFRGDVQRFLTQLSDTSDTLEMWVKVQMLWTSLESVFLGGDIAKQMPFEVYIYVYIYMYVCIYMFIFICIHI
jgi:dynein heavy chain